MPPRRTTVSPSKFLGLAGVCALLGAPACDGDGTQADLPTCPAGQSCVAVSASGGEGALSSAFAQAKDGQLVLLGAGTYKMTNTLALQANGITVRGAGIDKTILDFSGQRAGSEGVFAQNVQNLTLEGFTVADPPGNAVKVLNGTGVILRKLKAIWNGSEASAHGPYGLYPVQSKNVLIEDCVAVGASDAGIYLGQSQKAVLRRNEAYGNVAGLEVENTFEADVYENKTHDNTGGILVFDLPGLQQLGGHGVRVFKNEMFDNNLDNFAPKGNTVGLVPRGTGFFVMANTDVEVFDNTFRNNKTANSAIISYFVTDETIKDPSYYPYPSKIHVHDNRYEGGGDAPDLKRQIGILLSTAMTKFPGGKVPALSYDGIVDDKRQGPTDNRMQICAKNNVGFSFTNLHLDKLDKNKPNLPDILTTDAAPYDCALPPLPAVSFPGL